MNPTEPHHIVQQYGAEPTSRKLPSPHAITYAAVWTEVEATRQVEVVLALRGPLSVGPLSAFYVPVWGGYL